MAHLLAPWVGGETKVFDQNKMSEDTRGISFDSGKQTYPETGEMKLFQPWTGYRIHPYKPNEVTIPQTATYYKYSPICIFCHPSPYKPVPSTWHRRNTTLCSNYVCRLLCKNPFIFEFPTANFYCTRSLYRCCDGHPVQVQVC